MSQVDEAVLDLTVSEASLLADVLGVAPPPGLVDPDDDVTLPGSGDGAVAPGLMERRILDAEGTVAAPVANVLTVVGSPHLVARAVHEVGGVAEIRSYAVRPEMAVEQKGLDSDLVRFSPFHPGELVDRIMAFVVGDTVDMQDKASEISTVTFECPAETIGRVFADAAGGGRPSVEERVALLVAAAVEPEVASIFVAAADNVRSTNSVSVLHRPVEEEIVGVDLTWMDSADHGLWLNEPSESGSAMRLIEQLTGTELGSRLTRFLPFSSR